MGLDCRSSGEIFYLDDLPTEELAARFDDMKLAAAAHFNLPLRKGLHA